jgi:hypothetical protein
VPAHNNSPRQFSEFSQLARREAICATTGMSRTYNDNFGIIMVSVSPPRLTKVTRRACLLPVPIGSSVFRCFNIKHSQCEPGSH